MGMGLAGLGTASGAAQGLQEILAQRLRERQMALQEQAQREEMAYKNKALEADIEAGNETRTQNDLYRQAALALQAQNAAQNADYQQGRMVDSAARNTAYGQELNVPTAVKFKAYDQPVSGPSDEMLNSPLANEQMPPYRFEGNKPVLKLKTPEEVDQEVEMYRIKAGIDAKYNPKTPPKPATPRLVKRTINGKEVLDTWYPDTNEWGSDLGQSPVQAPRTADEVNRGVFMGRMSNVLDNVDKVSAHINTLLGPAASVAGMSRRAAAKVNSDPVVRSYLSQLDTYAVVVGRALGDNRISDFDVPRYRAMFPTPEDDKRVRDYKIRTLMAIFNADNPEAAKQYFEQGRSAIGIAPSPGGGGGGGEIEYDINGKPIKR
jgi:hypothetical protein